MKKITSIFNAIKSKCDEKSILLVSMTLFFAYLFMQHQIIGMYYDDFGNASLSYGYDSSAIAGTNYTVKDLYDWSKFIYFNWGGRIVYALILIPLLKTGPHLFMAIQSVIIMLTYLVVAKIIKLFRPEVNSALMAVLFIICFGVMKGDTLTQGYYWASASVLYVWPLLPFFLSIYLYEKIAIKCKEGQKVTFKDWCALIVLVPLSILSQEQLAGAFLVWAIVRTILNRIFETRWKGNVFLVIYSIVFFMMIILAPGNFARMDTNEQYVSQSFVIRTVTSFAKVLNLLTHEYLIWFNELLIVTSFFMLAFLFNRLAKKIWIVLFVALIPFSLINSFEFIGGRTIPMYFRLSAFLVYGIALCIIIVLLWGRDDQRRIIPIMVCAVASVFCLILSPAFSLRSCIPYLSMCTIMIIVVLDEAFTQNSPKVVRPILVCMLGFFMLYAVATMATTYSAYSSNYYADEYNRKTLFNYDGTEDAIYLIEYDNAAGRGTMSCDAGFEYIDYWMREFYDIPANIRIVWKDQNELLANMKDDILDVSYGQGFYVDEGSFRWAEQCADLNLYNISDETLNYNLSFRISAPAGEASLIVYLNDETVFTGNINENSSNVSIDIELLPGDNVVRIETDSKKVDSGSDQRQLYLIIESLFCERTESE